MKDKKTIGFDILDNAGLNEIDKIGTDIDMLDEKTKKRILEMTRKRYNDAIKGENTGIYDNAEDVVDNVEVYSRKKSSKIIMSVVNTAAVLGLAVGSVFLIKNLGREDNNPDTPLIPPDSTSVGTTGTDIETAAVNALDYLVATDEFIYSLDYAQIDMNGDNVPELIAHLHYGPYSKVCIFHYADGKYNFVEQLIHCSDEPVICLDEKRIYTFDYECDYDFYYQSYSTWDDELNFTEGDKLERVWGLNENNTCSYLLNDEIISEDEYKNKSENFVTGTKADVEFKNFYGRYSYMDEVGMTDEERIIRESIFEVIDYRNDPSYTKTFNANEDVYKIRYGFIDLNGDSVDEMIILEDFIGASYINIAYLNGNVYSSIMMGNSEEIRYDAENHKLYSILDDVDGYKTIIVEHLEGYDFLEYDSGESNIPHDWYAVSPTDDGGYMYICNNEPCARAEYEAAVAEYEACPEFKVDYTTYSVKYLSENPVQNQPVGLTQEETARNKRLEDEVQSNLKCYEKVIVDLSVDDLKIDYAYLDINNDSVDELFVRSKVLDVPESESTTIYFFNGTEYIAFYRIVADEFKFDLQNRKYYEILKENDDDTDYCILRIRTWENVEFSDGNQDYLTYFTPQDNYEGGQFYLHDDNRCTKEEYDKAMAEYENCDSAELNFIPYNVKKSEAAVNGQTAEENARNKRIEDYIQFLYECHRDEGENFYESIKIDYAYLDINNDSIDELFIRYNLYDNPEFGAIDCNYFDGTEYIPFKEFGIDNDWKLDLQNRKYYTMRQEKNEVNDHCVLFISTWENVEISHESEYFTLQDIYYSGIDPFIDGTGENVYLRNNEPCTKEEYDKAMAEYENCNSAELNFMPYTVKRESAEETEITLTFSNGKKPDGEVPIIFDLPAKANGRFVIAFMVQKEDGTTEIQESGTFYCPEYCQLTQNVIGSGENVNVTAIITNLSNNKRATIGTYSFNFAEGRYTCLSGGDPYTAFEDIGAFPETETEAPPPPKYGA